MPSPKTQPARGMRDFLPADVRKREYVIGVIKQVYERYGFEPLETPAVENIETLMGKYGEEGNQLIFKILKRRCPDILSEARTADLTDLALRYDLTVPLARVVAECRDSRIPKFFKRYQIQPVWRADRPGKGRFREFYQCDIDILDSTSMLAETEVLSAATDVLTQLGFREFHIRLNHRLLLSALLNSLGVPESHHADALIAIDKLDKIGKEGVESDLRQRGISTRALLDWLHITYQAKVSGIVAGIDEHGTDLSATNDAVLKSLSDRVSSDDMGSRALRDISQVLELSKVTSAGSRIRIDSSLARGLSYYTGSIFEIEAKGVKGSLGGGGRYDDLVGMFLGKNQSVPACGFSLGLERILEVMSELEMFPSRVASGPADVMVLISYQKDKGEKIEAAKRALNLARTLRGGKLRVYMYPVRNVEVQKQRSYAVKRGMPFTAIVDDLNDNVVIRDMRSGEEHFVSYQDAVDRVREMMRRVGEADDSIKPGA